jgi:osmoprotectant transport system permease protein
VRDQLALLPGYLTGHLQLALLSLVAGTAVSIPAGIAATRRPRLQAAVLGIASVVQTIPALALLAVMVPLLAAAGVVTGRSLGLEIPSIGFLPAFLALVLYSVLPILRNTVAGIASLDRAVLEAADGVGMTAAQRLRRIELPLALPVIVAGIRTSTVWLAGMATLSTPVGAPSLGNYIFAGLQTRNFPAVLLGCAAAAALALVLDALVRGLEKGVRDRRPRLTALAGAAVALLTGYAGVTLALPEAREARDVVKVGTKTFTEQYVLGEIVAERVRRATGAGVRLVPSLGSTVVFDALRSGAVDLYVDYTGTIWATGMKRTRVPSDRDAVLEEVRGWLAREHGILLVAPLGFENAYALAMRAGRAAELGVGTIGELAGRAPGLAIASDYEFFDRDEWRSLERVYGLSFRERRTMDPSLMYAALAAGSVDVISAYTTDGRIAADGLTVLEDDRRAIPPYDAILLAGPRLVRGRPEVIEALRALSGSISDRAMRRMNAAVDQEGESPRRVAAGFLDAWAAGRGPGR